MLFKPCCYCYQILIVMAWVQRLSLSWQSRSLTLRSNRRCAFTSCKFSTSNEPLAVAEAAHGSSSLFYSHSEHVTHVLVQKNSSSIIEEVQNVLDTRSENTYTARDLIRLGAVWYLPSSAEKHTFAGAKPRRFTENVANDPFILQAGDYLRIHYNPRRFPAVHEYDWSKSICDADSSKPGVIVSASLEKGWLVIHKPAMVPVHMTVDNAIENAVACLQQQYGCEYMAAPQRLDQNTSGLLVMATKKELAHYFATLLHKKTRQHVKAQDNVKASSTIIGGVHKMYKCLVCLMNDSKVQHDHLQDYVAQAKIIRHYLEPSKRAPKRFVDDPPDPSFQECLLKIRRLGKVAFLHGKGEQDDAAASLTLRKALWQENSTFPTNCHAVAELDIELLTGRTHQIRGQMAALGIPLVGDAQYGGAIVLDEERKNESDGTASFYAEQLALQCFQLEFLDPDIKSNGTWIRSNRWNKFHLDSAWWTPHLENYFASVSSTTAATNTASTTPTPTSVKANLASDVGLVAPKVISATPKPARPDLLPPRVQLSPGQNKYVLIRATGTQVNANSDHVQWFVKSAAPHECGGPYHGNVAQDLREWIEAAGYRVKVTGGGRIDYRPEEKSARVYGFSYGFGRGDHAHAAKLIQEWSKGEITATYDNSPDLY